MTAKAAKLYRETGEVTESGAKILTRGSGVRQPQTDLNDGHALVDIHAGHFWVKNLPDLTSKNEAYLEVTAVCYQGTSTKVAHQFKLSVDVKDETFSSNIQGVEMLTGIKIFGSGIELQCRLTELDKMDKDKFLKVKNFVDTNDIPGIVQPLIVASGPKPEYKELIKTLFSTVELIDELNDDDRVWIERPKLDLREDVNNPLYDGWYAFVSDHDDLPLKLYEAGGNLFTEYNNEDDNTKYDESSYFTFRVIKGI